MRWLLIGSPWVWVLFSHVLHGCALEEDSLERQVLSSLREKATAVDTGIYVDSVRLKKIEGIYLGEVFLSREGIGERDSIRVRSDLSGLEYEFLKPGELVSLLFSSESQ